MWDYYAGLSGEFPHWTPQLSEFISKLAKFLEDNDQANNRFAGGRHIPPVIADQLSPIMTCLNVTHKDDFWYCTEDCGDSFDRQMEHTNLKESLKDALSIAKTLSEANSTLTKTNATLTKQIETHTHAPPATSLPPPPPLSPDSNYPTIKDSIHNPKNHGMPDSYAQLTHSMHLIPIKPTRTHFLAPHN